MKACSQERRITMLLGALHEEVGPLAVGAATNHLDAKNRRLRINCLTNDTYRELEDGLLEHRGDQEGKDGRHGPLQGETPRGPVALPPTASPFRPSIHHGQMPVFPGKPARAWASDTVSPPPDRTGPPGSDDEFS